MSDTVSFEYSQADLPAVARRLLDEAGDCRIWLFTGEPGAGKTSLIQALAYALGVEQDVTSPTFTIHHVYESRTMDSEIHHFDLYRIRKEQELFEIGMEELMDGDRWCFIEWPAMLDRLRPDDYLDIRILHPLSSSENHRRIEVARVKGNRPESQ